MKGRYEKVSMKLGLSRRACFKFNTCYVQRKGKVLGTVASMLL